MRTIWLLSGLAVIIAICVTAITFAGDIKEKKKSFDNEALAEKLVNQCANIQEGDCVFITGSVHDLGLLEDVWIQIRKQGGFPLLSVESDRLDRRRFTDVPAKYDTITSQIYYNLYNSITAHISVDYNKAENLYADIPAERLNAVRKSYVPFTTVLEKRNVKMVNLGNGLYPTKALAQQFGIPEKKLSEIFWSGVNVDYKDLQVKCETMRNIIAAGKEMHITNPNGTDLRVHIENRPVYTSDGVISDDDIKRGNPACQTWLPAGDVYLAPVIGTAEGIIVVDRKYFEGKEIKGLTLKIEGGKVTSMTAKSGIERLKLLYETSESDKDVFSFINCGVNPNVKIVPGSRMFTWMSSGMITVGIGQNLWAGGNITSSFSMEMFLPGSTMTIDGKVIVEKGVIRY